MAAEVTAAAAPAAAGRVAVAAAAAAAADRFADTMFLWRCNLGVLTANAPSDALVQATSGVAADMDVSLPPDLHSPLALHSSEAWSRWIAVWQPGPGTQGDSFFGRSLA